MWTAHVHFIPGAAPAVAYDVAAPVPMRGFGPRTYSTICGVATFLAAGGLTGTATVELIAVLTGRPVAGVGYWPAPAVLILIALQVWIIGVLTRRVRTRTGGFGVHRPDLEDTFGGLSRLARTVLGALMATGLAGGLAGFYASFDTVHTTAGSERAGTAVAIAFFTMHTVVCCAEWLRCRAALRRSRVVT